MCNKRVLMTRKEVIVCRMYCCGSWARYFPMIDGVCDAEGDDGMDVVLQFPELLLAV